MDKLEELLLNSLSKKERATYFSQIGIIQNAPLRSLREQIKNITIPLLLKVFQLKIHLKPSSEDLANGESIIHKLKMLDSDSQGYSHKNWWSTFYKKFKNKNDKL